MIDWQKVNDKASSAALLSPAAILAGLMVEATAGGTCKSAYEFGVTRPAARTEANAHIY